MTGPAFEPGHSGVIFTLWLTGTTLNVMSLMSYAPAGGGESSWCACDSCAEEHRGGRGESEVD